MERIRKYNHCNRAMNQLSPEKRKQILSILLEGNSIRGTARICQCSINTIMKLLVEMGEMCLAIHDSIVRNIEAKRVQCDEIWSFVYSKRNNVSSNKQTVLGAGDAWTWVAIDGDSKLVISWLCGTRDLQTAQYFMDDLAMRVKNRIQLTTDGYQAYPETVKISFGESVDYARYVKVFGKKRYDPDIPVTQVRYSQKKLTGIDVRLVCGQPDHDYISTSFVERQNLTMRMHMRRFTRLTNGFSKKFDNHVYAQAIHFMYYNFCRIHGTLKTTPAVAAGVVKEPWTVKDLVDILISTEEHQRNQYDGFDFIPHSVHEFRAQPN